MWWRLAFCVQLALDVDRAATLSAGAVSGAARLRQLLEVRRLSSATAPAIALEGVHDALSARVLSARGAPALFMSGFGVAASRYGVPDAGLVSRAEMEEAARVIIRASAAASAEAGLPPPPVICDGDTGYGGAANVRATVRGLAAAGAAAVTIEDQCYPGKRCTIVAGGGVRVVSREAAVRRVATAMVACKEAAVQDGRDVMLVARTDCRASEGLDEAIARCVAFEGLGADVIYAENLRSAGEYRALRAALSPETVTVVAQVGQVEGEAYSDEKLGAMGYDFGLWGVRALRATVHALIADGAPEADFAVVRAAVGFDEHGRFEDLHSCE